MKIYFVIAAYAALLPVSAQADNILHPGTPVMDRPTLTSLGIQLPATGDDNYNSVVTVRYRTAGAASWNQAQPLYHVHPDSTLPYVIAPQFAGSILDLRPATTYEIQLTVTDPDGPVSQTFSLNGATRPVPGDPVSPRIVNVASVDSVNTALGGNLRAGDLVTLANGTYSNASFSIFASGTASNPIVIRGASQDGVIVDGGNCAECNVFEIYGSYIHLENMTIQNAQRAIKIAAPATQSNVIRRVHTKNTILGISTRENQLDCYIADNILEGRLAWPSIYEDDGGLHSDDNGIDVSGFGHVVAHNRISGFAKGIITQQSGDRSIDFYGNDILWSYDAAMKFSFLEGNGRIMRNRMTNVYMGPSLQPVAGGPAYIYRNVAYNVMSEQFKLHSHSNPTTEPNGVFMYNNTFVSATSALQLQTPTYVHHFALENNLFIGPPLPAYNLTVDWYGYIDDGLFDYNGYWPDAGFSYNYKFKYVKGSNLADLQATGSGLETHGLLANPQTLASGIVGPSDYRAFYAPQDFTLSTNSVALNRGVVLPNISDGYTGSAPDLGALETGCPAPIYGPRQPGVDETNEPLGCAQPAPAPIPTPIPTPTPAPSPSASCTASVASDHWKGDYFANTTLSGSPVMVRDDGANALSLDWGSQGSPSTACNLPGVSFSVRWTRQVSLTAGTYRFTTSSDDGMRLYVDGQLAQDRWFAQAASPLTSDVTLGGGLHTLTVEYYQAWGNASAAVSWQQLSIAPAPTPAPAPPPGTTSCVGTVSSDHWKGEYFSNTTLSGSPAMVRDDGSDVLNFNWGNQVSPNTACGLPGVLFSARWTRLVSFGAGVYRFTTSSDDGMRLYVDGQKVQDRWYDQAANVQTVDVTLVGGTHTVMVEYYQAWGNDSAAVSWQQLSGAPAAPPAAIGCVATVGSDHWKGEYFNNLSLSGSPVMVRDDGTDVLNFNWGNAVSPNGVCNVPGVAFSVRWTRSVNFSAGTYRFTTSSDDGMRLYIDGQKVQDRWFYQAASPQAVDVTLNGGAHTLVVEYFQGGGQDSAAVSWQLR